ncbi:MAG: alpha/beta hydrolase [Eubacteriales bacterium]
MPSKIAILIDKITDKVDPRIVTKIKMQSPARSGKNIEPPKRLGKKYDAQVYEVQGRKCVNMKSADDAKHHIMYFHGGAYASEPSTMHWLALGWIMGKIPIEVTFVNYPLSPEYTCDQTIDMAAEAYSRAFSEANQEIILMGDSAGGGLALALAQYINANGISPKPSKLILLSPWLDVSMDEDIPEELLEEDKFLDFSSLKMAGERYAGSVGTKDYRCSPIYGDLTEIADIALFSGTHDLLNLQARKLAEKIGSDTKKLQFYEYEEMPHVWMLIPMPEAEDAMNKVIEFIEK